MVLSLVKLKFMNDNNKGTIKTGEVPSELFFFFKTACTWRSHIDLKGLLIEALIESEPSTW